MESGRGRLESGRADSSLQMAVEMMAFAFRAILNPPTAAGWRTSNNHSNEDIRNKISRHGERKWEGERKKERERERKKIVIGSNFLKNGKIMGSRLSGEEVI